MQHADSKKFKSFISEGSPQLQNEISSTKNKPCCRVAISIKLANAEILNKATDNQHG